MREAWWSYWGKADDSLVGCHAAALHCLDVAAVAWAWLDAETVTRNRFARMFGLDGRAVVPTVACLIALHDIGKFDARFQMKAREKAVQLDPRWQDCDAPRKFDHGAWGFQFARMKEELQPLVTERLGLDTLPLLQAVCGHHGELPSKTPPAGPAARGAWVKPDQIARQDWMRTLADLFVQLGAALPWKGTASAALVTELAGFCAVADWVGSQVDAFPYVAGPVDLGVYFSERRERAAAVLRTCGLLASPVRAATFVDLFPGKTPRDVQLVTRDLAAGDQPALVIIEARMGSGKTEAAYALAHEWLSAGAAQGIYVALPTMATSNAMFHRIADVGPRMFEEPLNLVLAHGQARMQDFFQALIRGRLTAHDGKDSTPAQVLCARWFLKRKRALMSQLGVGTVDQAMHGALAVDHYFVRLFGLSRSVVILDEIHAYDAFMDTIIRRLLQWLGALDVPVILLSATLPAGRRQQLAEAYRGEVDLSAEVPAVPRGELSPYPLVTVAPRTGPVRERSLPTPLGSSTSVTLEHYATANPEEDVLPKLLDAATAGACVAWIRNTVREAQVAFERARQLDPGVPVQLFHARVRAKDRREREGEVLRDYGAGRRAGGRLLIATQVVEQSLDLDFDLLATDLAPVDLILQRLGRLHRHPRGDRGPASCLNPRLLLVQPPPEAVQRFDLGPSRYVYEPILLWLTWQLLRNRNVLRIPDDIRPMVEAVYDGVKRNEILGAADAEHREREVAALEKALARRVRALRECAPDPYAEAGHIRAEKDVEEDDVLGRTREGQSERLVLVAWQGDLDEGVSLDGGGAWDLNPDGQHARVTAQAILEEAITVPVHPWDGIENGARPRGDGATWDAWTARFATFCAETGAGRATAVPMRRNGDKWRGFLQRQNGMHLVEYDLLAGLSLTAEDR